MRTSKIKEVIEITGDGVMYNGTYYHNLVMENGDKINIGKKKQQQVGWELTYEITGDGQQEYDKAKSVNPDFKGGNQKTGPDFDKNIKGIKIGHAITNAVTLYCSEGGVREGHGSADMTKSIKEYAKMIYQISEELNNEL